MAMSANFDLVDSVLVLPRPFPFPAQMGSTAAFSDRGAARGDAARGVCHMRDVPESHAGCCAMNCEAGSIQGLPGAR